MIYDILISSPYLNLYNSIKICPVMVSGSFSGGVVHPESSTAGISTAVVKNAFNFFWLKDLVPFFL